MKDTIFPIDVATGEVMDGITMIDAEGWQIINHRKAKEAERNLRRKDHGPLGPFFLATRRGREGQLDGLSPQNVVRLVYLCTFLNERSILMMTERTSMTVSDLPRVLRVSKSSANRFWDAVKGKYITENKDSTLSVYNVFFRGKKPHKGEKLTKFFIDGVRQLYEATPVSRHRLLGNVFRLLPYVSIEFKVIPHNERKRTGRKQPIFHVVPLPIRCEQ